MPVLRDWWTNIYKANTFKTVMCLIMCAALCISFAACGDDKGNAGSGKKDEKRYETVAHLDFPIHNIKTLNPSISKDEDTYFITRLIYDGLYELDETMTPQNNLATSYKFDKSGGSVTCELTETEFHDGKAFNSDDVKFTVEAFKAAGKKCPYYSLIKNISYVETKGDRKVKIHFYSKNSMSLSMLTFPILPKHRYDGAYSLIGKADGFRPVGTGKYKYSSFKNEKTLRLNAYDGYHGEKAENTVSFVVSDASSAYQLVEAGSLSALLTTQTDREARVEQKEQEIIDFPANEVEYIGFNFYKDKTKLENIRKAVAYGIDTDAIIEQAFTNSGISNDSLFYAGFMGTENTGDPYPYDPAKTQSLLKKEGYKKKNSEGRLVNDSGYQLNLTMLVNQDSNVRSSMADMIEEDLEDIGINIEKVRVPEKTYKNYLKNGNFDIYVGALRFDETMDLRDILKSEKQPAGKNGQNGQYSQGTQSQVAQNTQNGSGSSASNGDIDEDIDYDDDEQEARDKAEQESKKQQEEADKHLAKKTDNQNFIRYYNGKLNDYLDNIMSGASPGAIKENCEKAKKILTDDLPYYCLLQRTYGAVQSVNMAGTMAPTFDNYYRGIGNIKSRFEITDDEEK